MLDGGHIVGYKLEKGPPKDHPNQAWLNLVQWFQKRFSNDKLTMDKGRAAASCPLHAMSVLFSLHFCPVVYLFHSMQLVEAHSSSVSISFHAISGIVVAHSRGNVSCKIRH
jgi:hypothetical protein